MIDDEEDYVDVAAITMVEVEDDLIEIKEQASQVVDSLAEDYPFSNEFEATGVEHSFFSSFKHAFFNASPATKMVESEDLVLPRQKALA